MDEIGALFFCRIFPPIFPDYEAWQAFQEPRVDRSTEPFTWGVLDVEGIISFLHIHAGLEKQIVSFLWKRQIFFRMEGRFGLCWFHSVQPLTPPHGL